MSSRTLSRVQSRRFSTTLSRVTRRMAALGVLVAGSLTGGASVHAVPLAHDMTDRLIVKYKDQDARSLSTARQVTGMNVVARRRNALGAELWRLDQQMSLAEARALANSLMSRDPAIEYAEPDLVMRPFLTPNDSRYAEQWDLFEATGGLRADLAWDKATGSGVTVAVLDTGYLPHADLSANLVMGYDFVSDAFVGNDGDGRDADARDPGDAVVAGECGGGQPAQDESSSWHGTHVAGTIAAVTNNARGIAGVAFGSRVLPVRVLGKCGGYLSDIADAVIWASGGSVAGAPTNVTPARVINLSLGGSGNCGATYQNAINAARSRGSVVVVAAGNSNTDVSSATPANCAGVITVAATGRTGGRAYYSNYGTLVDLAAPGGDMSTGTVNGILSTLSDGLTMPGADNYAFYQGTSMATPHVAGTVALMLSRNPALTPDEVETRIKSSARAFPAACNGCGMGLVDANAAVDAAVGTVNPPPSSPTLTAEAEPNNTLASANVVSASTTLSGTLASRTDTDYFRLGLPAGKTLSTSLALTNSRMDYDLYLYDEAGRLLASSRLGAGRTETINTTNTTAATVIRIVRVVYYTGPTGSTARYNLRMSW
jgi:serine protease